MGSVLVFLCVGEGPRADLMPAAIGSAVIKPRARLARRLLGSGRAPGPPRPTRPKPQGGPASRATFFPELNEPARPAAARPVSRVGRRRATGSAVRRSTGHRSTELEPEIGVHDRSCRG